MFGTINSKPAEYLSTEDVQMQKFAYLNKFLVKVVVVLGFVVFTPVAIADDIALPTIDYPQAITVDPGTIISPIENGALNAATQLATDATLQQTDQELYSQKKLAINVTMHSNELQSILNESGASNTQKSYDILKLFTNEVMATASSPSGNANLIVKHVPEFGAAELVWDSHVINNSTCIVWVVSYSTSSGWGGSYEKHYNMRRIPDYKVYRIVNGTEELVEHIPGISDYADNPWVTYANNAESYSGFNPGFDPSTQAFAIDWRSDYRNKDTTLAYKVVVDNSDTSTTCTGGSNSWTSTVTVDSNNDGLMDFIPSEEYQKFFGKYNAWFVPVLLLNES